MINIGRWKDFSDSPAEHTWCIAMRKESEAFKSFNVIVEDMWGTFVSWLVECVFIRVGIVIGLAVASQLVVPEILCKLIWLTLAVEEISRIPLLSILDA